MANPILVTGAAGRIGGVGRIITDLLLKQGQAVRAMVRTEDERAQALRDMGAEVVVGSLLDLDSMHRAIAGCETMYFSMSVSDTYLAATVNAAVVAKHHGVKAFINMSQMTLSQMSVTETTASPQHKLHWLAEQALNWSSLPVVHVRPTVFLEGLFLTMTADSVRNSNQIRLPFGEGKTSPVAAEDVARAVAALLVNPQPHIGKTYHPTGPQSENMRFYAQEYSKALGRTITYQDIPIEAWRDGLLQIGQPLHLVNHLTTLANLHRAGRFAARVAPALVFDPLPPGVTVNSERKPPVWGKQPAMVAPAVIEVLAFAGVPQLAELMRTRAVSSLALTQMYLDRLKRYSSQLYFAITLTEDRAMAKAKEADRDLAAGKYRGPLHGLPWGGKDLLAVAGYPSSVKYVELCFFERRGHFVLNDFHPRAAADNIVAIFEGADAANVHTY